MGIFNFGHRPQETPTDFELGLKFALPVPSGNAHRGVIFAEVFVFELFRKILTDCYDKAADFPKDKQQALWDSVVSTQAPKGLMSLLAQYMVQKQPDAYIKLDNGFVRQATQAEREEIDKDPTGKHGIKLDFSKFHRATILLILAALVELLLNTANAGLNLSRSILLKIKDLRQSVADLNAQDVIAQAKSIKEGILKGSGALLDAGDGADLTQFDPEPMEQALEVLFGLMSLITGLPRAYVSGELTSGLNATGDADEQAIERGLRFYFNSIFKPVCDTLFGCNLVYKTSNWRKFAEIAAQLPTLEMTELISKETKEALLKEVLG